MTIFLEVSSYLSPVYQNDAQKILHPSSRTSLLEIIVLAQVCRENTKAPPHFQLRHLLDYDHVLFSVNFSICLRYRNSDQDRNKYRQSSSPKIQTDYRPKTYGNNN